MKYFSEIFPGMTNKISVYAFHTQNFKSLEPCYSNVLSPDQSESEAVCIQETIIPMCKQHKRWQIYR